MTHPVTLALALALTLVSGAASVETAPRPSIEQLVGQAMAAKQRGDFVAMGQALEGALRQRPNHPRWSYHLAVARARGGDAAAALALLERVAAQGIAYQPETDPDLAALREDPAFAPIVARFAANRAPLGAATVAFTLADRALIPESVACTPQRRCFVSSVRKRSIVEVRPDGSSRPFVAPRQDGLDAALGLALDARRGRLWVASAALPQMEGWTPADAGRTGVFAFALDDGRLLRKVMLTEGGTPSSAAPTSGVAETAAPAFGDLRVLSDGALLVSDQQGGALYLLPRGADAFRRLTAPGALRSPQGVVVDRGGDHAWVADWSLGLMRVDLERGVVTRAKVAPGVAAYGIDGLYRFGRDLIAVQNGLRPNRVVRLELEGDRVVGQTVLVANDPRFSEPTLGAVLGDRFLFIANSQWDRLDEANGLPPENELAQPLVLEIPLR
jgi:hypothetical protein